MCTLFLLYVVNRKIRKNAASLGRGLNVFWGNIMKCDALCACTGEECMTETGLGDRCTHFFLFFSGWQKHALWLAVRSGQYLYLSPRHNAEFGAEPVAGHSDYKEHRHWETHIAKSLWNVKVLIASTLGPASSNIYDANLPLLIRAGLGHIAEEHGDHYVV